MQASDRKVSMFDREIAAKAEKYRYDLVFFWHDCSFSSVIKTPKSCSLAVLTEMSPVQSFFNPKAEW